MNYREAASLTVAGGALPLATVYAVVAAVAAVGLPGIVALLVLVLCPLVVGVTLALAAVRTGRLSAPGWLPVAGPDEFRDRVPERHHDLFSPETLTAPADEPPEPLGRPAALGAVYLISVPAYTLFYWFVVG